MIFVNWVFLVAWVGVLYCLIIMAVGWLSGDADWDKGPWDW